MEKQTKTKKWVWEGSTYVELKHRNERKEKFEKNLFIYMFVYRFSKDTLLCEVIWQNFEWNIKLKIKLNNFVFLFQNQNPQLISFAGTYL